MRFAGTCRQYSKKAMPQLARMISHIGALWTRRWPYQAAVMKTLEPMSNRMVVSAVGMGRIPDDQEKASMRRRGGRAGQVVRQGKMPRAAPRDSPGKVC